MSYSGEWQYYDPPPPPLPPRRPRSPGSTAHPAQPQAYWTYPLPPPPPGPPPPRSPGVPGEPVPPPIPPRPPGFEFRGPPVADSYLPPAPQTFPPPPLSPNRQAYPNTLPPPPPRPPLGISAGPLVPSQAVPSYTPVESPQTSGRYGHSPIPSPHPNTGHPSSVLDVPPPPGPPPQYLQASMSSPQGPVPAYDPSNPIVHTSAEQAHLHSQLQDNSRVDTQTPAQPSDYSSTIAYVHDIQTPGSQITTLKAYSQIPNSPASRHMPIQEDPRGQDVSGPPHPPKVSLPSEPSRPGISPYTQSAGPSSETTSPKPIDDLGASIQSLSINEPPPPHPPTTQPTEQPARPSYTSSYATNVAPIVTPPRSAPAAHDVHRHERSQTPPECVQACISEPVTFVTDWYRHPEAPAFWVCSKCYVDHIWDTRHRDAFRRERSAEGGEKRMCRFHKPRLRDRLFPDAAATGDLGPVLDFMRRRSTAVRDCAGIGAVAAAEPGLRWYGPRAGDIPNFVCCEACYEDVVLAHGNLAGNLEPIPQPQDPKALWACDFAVSFIAKEYESRARLNGGKGDWAGFAAEAAARLRMESCPGLNPTSTWRRPWFTPAAGRAPESIVICAACYCDQVWTAGKAEQGSWQRAHYLEEDTNKRVCCAFGSFNVKILMGRCHDTKDFSLFWRVVNALEAGEKFCDEGGIADGVWYTFRPGANGPGPPGFQICRACYLCVVEPLNLAPFFTRKMEIGSVEKNSDGKVLCCFNLAHPRLAQGFLPRLLEGYYTRDARALRDYASEYVSIPRCQRDQDVQNARWHGWPDCTICPECWYDFARRHEPLAGLDELRGSVRECATMCEMYSARMRNLYLECCENGKVAPNGGRLDEAALLMPLLQFSAHRRAVWCQTVVPIRRMLFESRIALNQQRFLNVLSSHYTMAGQIQEISMPSAYSYSQAGLGTFANHNLLQGAQYGAQAAGIMSGMSGGSRTVVVGQLEQQWRAVE